MSKISKSVYLDEELFNKMDVIISQEHEEKGYNLKRSDIINAALKEYFENHAGD